MIGELTNMPKYIDIDHEIQEMQQVIDEHKNSRVASYAFKLMIEKFQSLPPADVAPVVHAYWIPHLRKDFLYDHGPEFEFVDDGYVCSNCRHYETFRTNYCAQCGAKMDKEKRIIETRKSDNDN